MRRDLDQEDLRTRASYDAVAGAYADALSGELADKPLDRALLDSFAELCAGGGPVYDLGCGPGHVACYLAERGLEVRARLDREPWSASEYPSRRCYAFARRQLVDDRADADRARR